MEKCQENYSVSVSEAAAYLRLSKEEEEQMRKIVEVYPMAVPSYYLSLVNPADPQDPIRKMCIPTLREADWEGSLTPAERRIIQWKWDCSTNTVRQH